MAFVSHKKSDNELLKFFKGLAHCGWKKDCWYKKRCCNTQALSVEVSDIRNETAVSYNIIVTVDI